MDEFAQPYGVRIYPDGAYIPRKLMHNESYSARSWTVMHIGIDFGTFCSYSAISINGTLKPIKDPLTQRYSFPSSIWVLDQDQILTGHEADQNRHAAPYRYLSRLKRELGKATPVILGNKQFKVELLISEIFKKIKVKAEDTEQISLDSTVLTVPIRYGPHKRGLIEKAAKAAGFRNVTILEEPIAAALYYDQKQHPLSEGEIILVYDLGSETFDAALLKKKGQKFEVLGQPVSDERLGGNGFDRAIFHHLAKTLGDNPIKQLQQQEKNSGKFEQALADLHNWIQTCKHQLSEKASFKSHVPAGEKKQYSLNRQQFEALIDSDIHTTVTLCRQQLEAIGLTKENVSQVLLVGGSCRIPYIAQVLRKEFGKTVVKFDAPELVICMGAALQKAHSASSQVKTTPVGIDLGTTNSVVSVFRKSVVETLPVKGRSFMPSVVSWRSDGTVMVGHSAKSRILIDADNTLSNVKRDMDNPHKYYRGQQNLTPPTVSGLILKCLVEEAEKALEENIRDVVITVPAYFTEEQRQATRLAGEKAGLNVLRLIPEPTAAAIAYGLDKSKDQTIMVYDLGGGTFDVSILAVKDNSFTAVAVGGDGNLGGNDFDEAIVQWASKKFQAQTGINILHDTTTKGKLAKQQLREAAETAKIQLSETSVSRIEVPDCLGYPLDLELSLTEYNQLIDPLIQRTVECMRSVLKDADLTPEDIDRVILVGGSTRNQVVREAVTREVKDPFIADRVDEVVAHGAAIVASTLTITQESALPIEIKDVTAHSLGVDMLTLDDELFFQPIIRRQSIYPCRYGRLAFTSRPYQKEVLCKVFRGENRKPTDNTYLGELPLPIPLPQQEQIPVGLIFSLDADGIIEFTMVQLPNNLEVINHLKINSGDLDLGKVDRLIETEFIQVRKVKIQT